MIFTRLTFTKYLSLFYMLGLAFTYFAKKKRYGFDNKYYSMLINLNVYGLILHIVAENASYYYTPIISDIVFKGILFYFITYSTYFLCFIFDEIEIKNNKILIKISQIICIICCFLAIILPSELHRDIENMVFYTHGLDTKVAYVHGFVTLISLFVFLVVKYKLVPKKKRFYILGYTVGLMMAATVQRINPEIAMSIYVECFLCTMMYLTIENPDVEKDVYMAAKNQAIKAGRAKEDFLSSMSHELRTPLNAIVGLSEMIKNSSSDPESRNDAKEIVVASQDLLELVNSILNVNSIENNTLDLEESNYDFKEMINKLSEMINLRVTDKDIEFISNISNDIPNTLYGDKEKIRTIITNLLSNAIKYTNNGKIELIVSCVNKGNISKLEIVVKDTGRGISKEQQANLFTTFNRREEDKDSNIKGVGLGLAITKSLVDLMEGTIKVDSEENVGSTFTVAINQKIIEQNNIEVL